MDAAAHSGRGVFILRSRKGDMTMLPADGSCIESPAGPPVGALEKILRALSVITMLMTVPQVLTIWVGHNAGGVSLLSWGAYLVSACFWFVYGVGKRDKTIYLACIGWIALDLAIVAGAVVYR
jgi:uncharacterized protein with PQ loop repeat